MKIAITSGKGGTGKTTVSTGLFQVLTKHLKYNVQLLDCDVKEPDCHIFIKASGTATYPVNIVIPAIDTGIILFDSSPGTSCPVVATVSKADYVVMVTEPTPFGLHDLKFLVETLKQLGKKYGIIVNKAGLNFKPLYDYIHQNAIPLIGEIPFRKELARAYSKGDIIAKTSEELKDIFIRIINKILNGKAV